VSEIEIVGYKCRNCGHIHYPRHEQCLNCKHREFEEISPQGNVKLITFTQIFNLPWGFDQRFLIIGIGEFENGLKAMGQIETEAVEDLETGMVLKASWEPVRYEFDLPIYGLKFEPL
jgi:hypothetical protein